jgi:hypothetical protein
LLAVADSQGGGQGSVWFWSCCYLWCRSSGVASGVSQDALAGHNSVKDAEVYQQNTISSFVILPCVLKTNMKLMVLNMV